MDEKEAANRAEAAYARSLKGALRRARVQEAARADAHGVLTDSSVLRLQVLADLMQPVLEELPPDVDLFDTGVVPGHPPRYWIDMTSFVDVAEDFRTYRFWQDSRTGRGLITQTPDAEIMADALTAYIAQRLVEREQRLASPVLPQRQQAAPAKPNSPWQMQGGEEPSQWPPQTQAQTMAQAPSGYYPGPMAPPPASPPQGRLSRWREAARSSAAPPQPAPAPAPYPPQAYASSGQAYAEASPYPPYAEQPHAGQAPPPWAYAEAPPARPRLAGLPWLSSALLFVIGIAVGAAAVVALALSAR